MEANIGDKIFHYGQEYLIFETFNCKADCENHLTAQALFWYLRPLPFIRASSKNGFADTWFYRSHLNISWIRMTRNRVNQILRNYVLEQNHILEHGSVEKSEWVVR